MSKRKVNKQEVDISQYVPKVYKDFAVSFLNNDYNEYVLKGGRGSVKSTIASLLAVLNVVDGRGSSVCIRRYKTGLRGSCYNDIAAILDRLGISDEFIATTSPLQYKHIETGLIIAFRGLDDPQKIKSLKSPTGQFTFLWFEESQEIEGYAKCRSVIQTVARGGKHCNVIFCFNPPPTKTHWVNKDLSKSSKSRLVLHTTYLDIPKEWLGEQFLGMAEELKEIDFDAYRNEYLGEAVGSKGMIFPNVRRLSSCSIEYDKSRVYRGNDFGFANDPNCYVAWYYDKKLKVLVLKYANYSYGLGLDTLASIIKEENKHSFTVYCDSAEPRSVSELVKNGVLKAFSCTKSADSIRHGIKWLQSLHAIYIDDIVYPEVYKEFSEYEYPRDKNGEYVSEYPDKDNHSIDATRYACQDLISGILS